MLEKKSGLEALILKLLDENNEVTAQDIVRAGNLTNAPADRRAIQRVLAKLIQQEIVEARGNARARVYLLKNKISAPLPEGLFKNITLSDDSTKLLKTLLKPINGRKPVGYNQDFLQSYIPNKTFYLNSALRKELLTIGTVEPVIRPAGTYARNILNRLLIDLSWNSSRLEGNTYSLLETKRLIELGESAPDKNAMEAQMILNHKGAIEYLVELADEEKFSAHELYSLHALLSDNLLADPLASGRIRNIAVGISGTTYFPLDNPHILKECVELLIKKINAIKDPFEQSFFALTHISYLRAFEDVNKQTARLVANIPLIKKNLKPLSFVDVNQQDYALALIGVYEKNDISLLSDLFAWAYKRSAERHSAVQQSMGDINLFRMKYRQVLQEIVRTIILEKVPGSKVVQKIKKMITALKLPKSEADQLFQTMEVEIISLHDNNIARFKIRPSEFQAWKNTQRS